MAESIQHKLDRVRPPRVQITYDVEIGGAIEKKELAFVMGILADLSGLREVELPNISQRKFVEIDRDNFNDVLKGISPHLKLVLPNKLIEVKEGDKEEHKLAVDLHFENMNDFEPVPIIKQVPELKTLFDSRNKLKDMLTKLDGNEPLENILLKVMTDPSTMGELTTALKNAKPEGGILDTIFNEGHFVLNEFQKEYGIEILQEFAAKLDALKPQNSDPVTFLINTIAQADEKISLQLDAILHATEFQALEGSWRGLFYLVMNTETSTRLKLRLLNISKAELAKDLEKAVEFDQSSLFKKIYEEEYGTFGGNPYSCLIGDFYFEQTPVEIELLDKITEVAAAAHAPFVTGASPSIFNLKSFQDIGKPRDLSKIFDSVQFVKWNAFRAKEDSRYAALTLPRVLIRSTYGPDTSPVDGLNYKESVDGMQDADFCWSNPAYILGQRITNAFALYSWTVAIRGVEGGGLVEDLPVYTFKTKDGDIALACPTEVQITDRREKELSDLGFISLCHCKGKDYAAFFGGQTSQKPKVYNLDAANSNAALSCRLPYMLATSRFAHYIKSIMRDKIGSFMTRKNVETYLNTWLADYILLNDDAGQEVKARYPLREGRIDVFDIPGKPGYYRAVVYLRPHFQLEDLTVSLRLVADLPPPAKA